MDDEEGPDTRGLSHEEKFGAGLQDLAKRCDVAGIRLSRESLSPPDPENYLVVHMPSGRSTRPVVLFDSDRLAKFLSIEFEKYVFLSGLAAVCSYSNGTIEAALRFVSPMNSYSLSRHLFGISAVPKDEEDLEEPLVTLEVNSSNGPAKLALSPESRTFRALGITRRSRLPAFPPSLKIEGLQIGSHDAAFAYLTRLANAFFFQLDVSRSVAITLMTDRSKPVLGIKVKPVGQLPELEFPRQEYEDAPISLYWYARSARGMPLLQFLAYYQVVEYYFPAFSKAEASRRIRAILKDPTFRIDRDSDVARILTALRLVGSGFGDERTQLRATILECVDPTVLRDFITESDSRARFLASKSPGLTDKRLPIANVDADLRNDVADRVYDIRCRIVHTKGNPGGSDVEMLLPFSPQAEQLDHDIDLIRFVARSVLVAASVPLHV